MKVKNAPVRFKAGPEDGLEDGEFLVYPSTFTREPDAYGDVVRKGAFADTIKEWKDSGNVLPGLYGHRMDDPDFYVASAIDQGEDEHGWWVKGVFDLESPKGKQTYRLVRGKRLTQLSFAYDSLDEDEIELDDGRTANELRKVKVHEFSFVPVGANQDTSVVAVKSAVDALTQTVVDKITEQAKAGRSLSAKNETALREARDSIDSVLASLDAQDEKSTQPGGKDQEKASGTTEATDDANEQEPEGATSSASPQEPRFNPSARALAAHTDIYASTAGVRKES